MCILTTWSCAFVFPLSGLVPSMVTRKAEWFPSSPLPRAGPISRGAGLAGRAHFQTGACALRSRSRAVRSLAARSAAPWAIPTPRATCSRRSPRAFAQQPSRVHALTVFSPLAPRVCGQGAARPRPLNPGAELLLVHMHASSSACSSVRARILTADCRRTLLLDGICP